MDRQLIEQIAETNGQSLTATVVVQAIALRAVTQLVSPIAGKNVLDLECGDGNLSRWLAVHGAQVTGVDRSPQVIEAARRREIQEPHGISYLVGDPEDLYMIDDSTFDGVVCNLSLSRIEAISAVIAEVSRIISLGGRFIFSVIHPCFEMELFRPSRLPSVEEGYFVEGQREALGDDARHRTLATYINAVAARGFTVRRVMEPSAEDRDVCGNPEFEAWCRMPSVLVVEAVFPHI